MRSVTRGEIVTLSCEIYGYLSSSQDITWTLVNPDTVLSSDSTYTITTRDGNRLIQNGGLLPSPSFISDLTFTHNTSQPIQIYTCAFLTTQKIFTLTLTDVTTLSQTETGKSIIPAIGVHNRKGRCCNIKIYKLKVFHFYMATV